MPKRYFVLNPPACLGRAGVVGAGTLFVLVLVVAPDSVALSSLAARLLTEDAPLRVARAMRAASGLAETAGSCSLLATLEKTFVNLRVRVALTVVVDATPSPLYPAPLPSSPTCPRLLPFLSFA